MLVCGGCWATTVAVEPTMPVHVPAVRSAAAATAVRPSRPEMRTGFYIIPSRREGREFQVRSWSTAHDRSRYPSRYLSNPTLSGRGWLMVRNLLRTRPVGAARSWRQTGNRIAGPSPGEVTDLADAGHMTRKCGFPRVDPGRGSSRFLAGVRRSDKVGLRARGEITTCGMTQ